MYKELESKINEILFEIGKDINIHKLIDGNLILEIDYDKYTHKLINIFEEFKNERY